MAQRRSRPVRMCSRLWRSQEASRPARTDSSAKQKSIGLLADGWGSTPSQTLKPLFPAGQTPQLRVDTLCSQRLPPCELTHTSTHYVQRRQKLIIRTVGRGAKGRLKFLRVQQLARQRRRDLSSYFLPSHLNGTRDTRDKRRLLHLSPVTTESHLPTFVSLQFCQGQRHNGGSADVRDRL